MTNKSKKSYNRKGRGTSSSSNSLVDGTKSLFKSGKIDLSPISEKKSSNHLEDGITIGGGLIIILGIVIISLKMTNAMHHI